MNVDELLGGARDAISVRRVFGDPIEHDGVMVVPVAKVGGGAEAEATTSTTAAASAWVRGLSAST